MPSGVWVRCTEGWAHGDPPRTLVAVPRWHPLDATLLRSQAHLLPRKRERMRAFPSFPMAHSRIRGSTVVARFLSAVPRNDPSKSFEENSPVREREQTSSFLTPSPANRNLIRGSLFSRFATLKIASKACVLVPSEFITLRHGHTPTSSVTEPTDQGHSWRSWIQLGSR